MPDTAQIHRRTELRLNELARKHFGPGVFHVDLRHIAALGRGNLEAGEALLHRMFRMSGPRSIHPDAVRQVGNGSIAAGRKVLEKFIARAQQSHGQGSAVEPNDFARGGAAKLTKEAAGYRNAIEDGQFCALCSMFIKPNRCSLVEGKISRTALCDHYEKA
jgi:hypothetical protein